MWRSEWRRVEAHRLVDAPVYRRPYSDEVVAVPDAPPVGSLCLVVGEPDPEGDLTVVFDDGRVESVSPRCLDRDTTAAGRLREELARSAFLIYDDDFLAIEAYADLLARARDARRECSRCGERKPLGEFHTDAHRPDGLFAVCRSCRAAA